MPNSSTITNSQSKTVTPEKNRRSKHLYSDNKSTNKTKSNINLKFPPMNNKEVKSILYTTNTIPSEEKEKKTNRVAFLKDLYVTKFAMYCELFFEV